MIKFLKKILSVNQTNGVIDEIPQSVSEEKKVQIATCTLFIELANADSDFAEVERKKIIFLMKDLFNLEDEYINELIELSENNVKESDSIYEYTTIINEMFSTDEKFELIKNLWRLVFIDNQLDAYEEHLVKKIGGLLNIEYQQIIGAKLLVKKEKKQ